jgi:hypothetical protein
MSELCNMCENPYPFMCSECQQCIEEELQTAKEEKKFIGSGEDVMLEEENE